MKDEGKIDAEVLGIKPIQGFMFVRNVSGGKTILLGIIDTPDPELQGEAQHEFNGYIRSDGTFSLKTMGNIINIREKSIGLTPDGLLKQPIWRN